MSDKPLAQRAFDAKREWSILEGELEDAILAVLGLDLYNPFTWGFDDFIFDDYDSSFELRGVTDLAKFVFTDEQKKALAELGFQQAWVCTKPSGEYDPGVHTWFTNG